MTTATTSYSTTIQPRMARRQRTPRKSQVPQNPASSKTLTPVSRLKERAYRFYSPGLGRWMNRDPIAERGGWNLYALVRNDPTDKCDALGFYALTDSESGVEDCGVVVLATHNFNVSDYAFAKAGCRKAAFVTCASATKVPPIKESNPWTVIDIPLSTGFVGDVGGDGVNAGFGEGLEGFIKFMKYVLNTARGSAEGLCPSDQFVTGEKIENPDTKEACDPCDLYRKKASGSRKGFFAYNETTFRCCHCKNITLRLRSPMPGDLTTLQTIMRGGDFVREIGAMDGSSAIYNCKKKTWSGTTGLYKDYTVPLPNPGTP